MRTVKQRQRLTNSELAYYSPMGERGALPNVPELINTIQNYVENHNRDPKPFISTAHASDILAKVVKARARLNKLQSV